MLPRRIARQGCCAAAEGCGTLTRSLRRLPLIAAVLAAWLPMSSVSSAADWPQWRGPSRDGSSPERGCFVTWPPEKLWSASVGLGYSSVVVAAGRAYVMGHVSGEGGRGTDTVWCLDAQTGKELWKHSYDCLSSMKDKTAEYFGPRATPVADGDAVYTLSLEGHVFCLSAATGKVRWSEKLDEFAIKESPLLYGYCASPVVHGDRIVFHLSGACMALAKADGKPLWRRKGGAPMFNGSSPVVVTAGGKACVVFGEQELLGVDVESGTKVWDYPLERAVTMTPVISGSRIFFSTYPNKGFCGAIDVAGGSPKPLWTNRQVLNYHVGCPALWEGHLYGVDCSRTEFSNHDKSISSLKCIEFETGALKWTQKEFGWSQVIAADGKLLVQRESGELVLAEASPAGYKELGRSALPEGVYWALPALADGKVFCRSNAGEVICLRVGAK